MAPDLIMVSLMSSFSGSSPSVPYDSVEMLCFVFLADCSGPYLPNEFLLYVALFYFLAIIEWLNTLLGDIDVWLNALL